MNAAHTPPPPIAGVHHLTAFVSDPDRCIRFYRDMLGLRMVKQTVNYDDNETWHLYFADTTGRPGTVLTFFPWPEAGAGRPGRGQITATTLAVSPGSLACWRDRLQQYVVDDPPPLVGEGGLVISDEDGLIWRLREGPGVRDVAPWSGSDVPSVHFISGIRGVTLVVGDVAAAGAFLESIMGAMRTTDDVVPEHAARWSIGDEDGAEITLIDASAVDAERGRFGPGTVHHVAWRVADDAAHVAWRDHLRRHNVNVTDIKERIYFRSIYFREPGSVVFEIATDGPGFTVDEPTDALGTSLRLPPWLEADRERLTAALPPLNDA